MPLFSFIPRFPLSPAFRVSQAQQPEIDTRHVFVYGTLRRGEQRDITSLRPAPTWVGSASLQGVLYDLGAYPGVVLGGHERVLGEVYRIDPQLERQLDEIEEVWPQQSGEYRKREVQVLINSPALKAASSTPLQLACLVYEVAVRPQPDRPVISSGDWVKYRLSRDD